jgi:hypothetical protein
LPSFFSCHPSPQAEDLLLLLALLLAFAVAFAFAVAIAIAVVFLLSFQRSEGICFSLRRHP